MNVLQLISSTGYYGAESMLLALSAGLTRRGCKAVVGTFRDARSPHTEIADQADRRGIPVEIIPCAGKWDWRAVRVIGQIISRHQVDVIHTHGYKADLMGSMAAWRGRAALVATCHNWPDRRLSMRAYAVLDRLMLRRFDAVAAASDPVAKILKRSGIRGARALPNGVDLSEFDDAPPSIRGMLPAGCETAVGFVGRMVEDKGGSVLLRSARQIIRIRPNVAFVFVGDGPCRSDWEGLADQLGIRSNVVFTGVRRDMAGVYSSLDMIVLPSWNEATPMCLLEAMAARRPVVASAVGSVPAVVIPGVTGLLCNPGDVAGLSAAIGHLIDDARLAHALAERAREHVARHFSSDVTTGEYTRLYHDALSKHEMRKPK
jgi:glycosyltransferase involved in cell wall biosynthesis